MTIADKIAAYDRALKPEKIATNIDEGACMNKVYVVEANKSIHLDGFYTVGVFATEEQAVEVCRARNTEENLNWFSYRAWEVL